MEMFFSESLINSFKGKVSKTARLLVGPAFIFTCGKYYEQSKNRITFEKYIKSNKNSENIRFIVSEKIWDHTFSTNIDLLSFEEFLAEVSDSIVIFIESDSSKCELGAFAFSNDELGLIKKIIAINDIKYRNTDSFISKGPIEKICNNEGRVIFANLGEDQSLLQSNDIRLLSNELISSSIIPRYFSNKKEKENVKIKDLIFGLLELIEIIEPVSMGVLFQTYKRITDKIHIIITKQNGGKFSKEILPEYIKSLLIQAQIIEEKDGLITLIDKNPISSFLFKRMSERTKHRLRCKALCEARKRRR